MKIGFASDHRGFKLKNKLIEYFKNGNYEAEDYGTYQEESTDYPDYAFELGKNVVEKNVDFGVAICGSGIGISIACNKVKGVRCAKVNTLEDVYVTRNDNDSNIVAFGEKMDFELAKEIVEKFITTPCSMEEKHVRRRDKIRAYEEKN